MQQTETDRAKTNGRMDETTFKSLSLHHAERRPSGGRASPGKVKERDEHVETLSDDMMDTGGGTSEEQTAAAIFNLIIIKQMSAGLRSVYK